MTDEVVTDADRARWHDRQLDHWRRGTVNIPGADPKAKTNALDQLNNIDQ